MTLRRITSHDRVPSAEEIDVIRKVFAEGGIAILPTDTLYGLHAPANSSHAVARIFAAKRRAGSQPLVVLCSSIDQVRGLGVQMDESTARALDGLWPAPLTAILRLREPLAATVGLSTAAVRIPDLAWLRELLESTGPLASTSVNLSGERAVYSTDEIPMELLEKVDALLDGGTLASSASTLVDFTSEPPRVVREGKFLFTQNLWKTMWKSS